MAKYGKKKPCDTPNTPASQRETNQAVPHTVAGHKHPEGPEKPRPAAKCGYGKGAKIK